MLNLGLNVTVNSDDPAYFGGYINANYLAIAEALNLTQEDIVKLVKNSFNASFADQGVKDMYLKRVNEVVRRERDSNPR